jgi:hypothetical protein
MDIILSTEYEYRGYFISEFAKLERAIDVYLATYFVPDNPNVSHDLIAILIDRLGFENKRTALRALFDIKNSLDTSNHKKTPIFKKIIDECGELARIRNYFAHYHPVMITDKMKNENDIVIGLVQFRDSLKIIWYNKTQFSDLIDKITLTRSTIEKLRKNE